MGFSEDSLHLAEVLKWATVIRGADLQNPQVPTADVKTGLLPATAPATAPGPAGHAATPGAQAARQRAWRAARQIVLAAAADLLSGPAGLAACLRTGLLDGPAAAVSLPLDVGAATETIPAHLRRAVTARDRQCRLPGCGQSPAACQPHQIVPRSQGSRTSLPNLLLLCTPPPDRGAPGMAQRRPAPDGTVTATSPDGTRTHHSRLAERRRSPVDRHVDRPVDKPG